MISPWRYKTIWVKLHSFPIIHCDKFSFKFYSTKKSLNIFPSKLISVCLQRSAYELPFIFCVFVHTKYLSLTGQKNTGMSKQETLLVDRLRSELILQQQLKTLSESLRQQLLETERRHRKELDRRINENALMSTDQEFKHEVDHQNKSVSSHEMHILY